MYDVLVIGGGPAGSHSAYCLADLGHKVGVIEHKAGTMEKVCCTGIISQECVTTFGIDESIILRRVNSARIVSPSGKVLHLQHSKLQVCIVDRPALDTSLVNRAQDKGAEYLFDSQVKSVTVGHDGVQVEVARGERSNLIEARAVVLANGFDAKLSRALGLRRIGDAVTGAQVEVEADDVDEVEVYLGREIAPGFFAWLVPTTQRRALVGLMARHNAALYLRKLVASLLDHHKITSVADEPGYRGIALKSLPRTYGQRLLVVGSAAGQVKPTTGGGIYYGLLGADFAASTLHQALVSDNLSAKNLAGYQRNWQKKLGQELTMGNWARRFYERLSDSRIDRIFDVVKSNGLDTALMEDENLSFDWHSGVITRLLGYKALSGILEIVKVPSPLKRRVEL